VSSAVASQSDRIRVVDRLVVHGDPVSFRELCAGAVPPSTRYLVLDLDRTVHLARNMGELLGWEIGARKAYGAGHLEQLEGRRAPGRYLFDASRPLALSKYVLRGARCWAYPGLFYLLWGRIAGSTETSERLRFHRFGTEPYHTIQQIPSIALLHELAGTPLAVAREMAASVLARHAGDEVIGRDDIAWLRRRCPGLQIILSSASPQPVVEAAAQRLGVDACEYLEIEVHDGRMSSPFQLGRLFLHARAPHRLCPPSLFRPNSGRAKLERLLQRYPEMRDPNVETVGITDTWHGDDHCWADFFTRVVDINSKAPFPPLVAAQSPVRAIHSANVLTRGELRARLAGQHHYIDRRRYRHLDRSRACNLGGAEIAARIADISPVIGRLAARRAELETSLAPALGVLDREERAIVDRVEAVVADYNATTPSCRRGPLASLYQLLRAQRRLARKRARVLRPLSDVAFRLWGLLERSRTTVVEPRPIPQLVTHLDSMMPTQ